MPEHEAAKLSQSFALLRNNSKAMIHVDAKERKQLRSLVDSYFPSEYSTASATSNYQSRLFKPSQSTLSNKGILFDVKKSL